VRAFGYDFERGGFERVMIERGYLGIIEQLALGGEGGKKGCFGQNQKRRKGA